MKQITREMERKYGCLYCLDLVTENYYKQKRYKCKHDSCPYTELEAYKSYEDYFKSKGGYSPMAWQFNINDRSGGDMTRAMMENNADAFISYFYGYMTAEAMAGILGNIQHESYINPGQCQIGSGTSTNSRSGGGLIQWTPRSAFISWCNARGLTWYDGDVQCYRIKCEGERKDGCSGIWLKTSQYPYTWQEFCHLTDYEEACKAYLAERERAGVAALSKRLQYAAQWYAYIKSSTPIPDPDPSPTPPDPRPYENNLARYGGIKDLQRRGIISNGKL